MTDQAWTEIVEAAKTEAGTRDLIQMDLRDGEETTPILLTIPTRIEWLRFISDLTGTDDLVRKSQIHENFVYGMAKYPKMDALKPLFERKCGIPPKITDELGKYTGQEAEVRSKKL